MRPTLPLALWATAAILLALPASAGGMSGRITFPNLSWPEATVEQPTRQCPQGTVILGTHDAPSCGPAQ